MKLKINIDARKISKKRGSRLELSIKREGRKEEARIVKK